MCRYPGYYITRNLFFIMYAIYRIADVEQYNCLKTIIFIRYFKKFPLGIYTKLFVRNWPCRNCSCIQYDFVYNHTTRNPGGGFLKLWLRLRYFVLVVDIIRILWKYTHFVEISTSRGSYLHFVDISVFHGYYPHFVEISTFSGYYPNFREISTFHGCYPHFVDISTFCLHYLHWPHYELPSS